MLATLVFAACAQSSGPSYSAAGLVNAATNLPGPLSPNTWATLRGSNLAWSETAVGPGDIKDNTLPTQLGGVKVLFSGGTPAPLKMVSPGQINFLVPLRAPGDTTLRVTRDGTSGPALPLAIVDVSPGLFQTGAFAVATHPDGSAINSDTPAQPGEVVTLSATGLGQTQTPLDQQDSGRLVQATADPSATRIERFQDLAVTLNDGWVGTHPVGGTDAGVRRRVSDRAAVAGQHG